MVIAPENNCLPDMRTKIGETVRGSIWMEPGLWEKPGTSSAPLVQKNERREKEKKRKIIIAS